MARTYKRDSNGRFASTGGARSGRPAAKPVSRGKNRITRDNAGRITSVGGEGATARGGRLRTAAGNKRAVQTARIKGGGGRLRKPVGGGRGAANAPKTSLSSPASTVFNAQKTSERIARANANINRTKWEAIRAERIARSVKSRKAVTAMRKAQKSLMTATTAKKFLTGAMNSDTSRRGSRYLAGNRGSVSPTYSFSRVAGAFRAPKSRILAPVKNVRIGKPIYGSGNQLIAKKRLPRASAIKRRKPR